jgi:hypothetical protein
MVGVAGGVCLPHLELRHGDLGLYLRLVGPDAGDGAGDALDPFAGKTPVVAAGWSGEEDRPLTLRFPREASDECPLGELLATLAARLERVRDAGIHAAGGSPAPRETRRALKTAA